MKSRQTYDVLAQAMDEIFQEYEIDRSKITNIVTDGGSAFCKMFKKYGEQIDAVVVDTNGDEITDEDSEIEPVQSFMVDDFGEGYINEVLSLDSGLNQIQMADETSGETNYQDYFLENASEPAPYRIVLPPQLRCVSHLLNLLSQNFEKKLDGLAKNAFKNTFDTLHSLWVITRNSSRAKAICKEILGEILKFPCETRWNSKFDCIKQCNKPEIQSKLNKLSEKLKLDLNSNSAKQLKVLTTNNFSVMQQYEKVLGPVARALDILQGELNNSQGDILPVLLSMKTHISRLIDSNNIVRDFKATILKLIDTRFGSYFEYNASNKDFLLAAVTLPRFKMNFIADDADKIYVKNLLINECKKMCRENGDEIENIQRADRVNTENDFIISFESNSISRRHSIENVVESEISQYLMDSNKETSILDQYPTVRAVFYKYNTTLPSSASVERVFSQSQMIFTPRRNRITSENFEKTLILKHNRMLLDENCYKIE